MRIEANLMRGAGPVAVMRLLSERGEMYGYELVDALAKRTGGVLDMGQATLYPMLYNLEAKGLVESRWEEPADKGAAAGSAPAASRARKYYCLTAKGKTRLREDVKQWRALAGAMESLGVIGGATRGALS